MTLDTDIGEITRVLEYSEKLKRVYNRNHEIICFAALKGIKQKGTEWNLLYYPNEMSEKYILKWKNSIESLFPYRLFIIPDEITEMAVLVEKYLVR